MLRDTPPPFVIEGDEYDTAFFEKTAKFLHYSAEVVVLTSIEHDHIDIYPTLEAYLWPFRELVARLPEQGLVVANAADEHVVRVVREHATVPRATGTRSRARTRSAWRRTGWWRRARRTRRVRASTCSSAAWPRAAG